MDNPKLRQSIRSKMPTSFFSGPYQEGRAHLESDNDTTGSLYEDIGGAKKPRKAAQRSKAKCDQAKQSSSRSKSSINSAKPNRESPDPDKAVQKELDKVSKAIEGSGKRIKSILKRERDNCSKQAAISGQLENKLRTHFSAGDRDLEMDDRIRDEFQILMKQVRAWSEKWATEKDITEASSAVQEAAHRLVVKCYHAASDTGFKTAFDASIAISALMHAIVAHHLSRTIFEDRFFLFRDSRISQEQISIWHALWFTYHIGQQVDDNKANVWLSQTLSLLHPKGLKCYDYHLSDGITMAKLKQAQISRLAEDFSRNPDVACLLQLEDDDKVCKRLNELYIIIENAADLALRIGVQKVSTSIYSYDALHGRKFSNFNHYMNLHPSMLAEANDARCQGQHISLVIEPAILALGDEEGKNYGQKKKVWSKALVWFYIEQNPPAPFQPESSARVQDQNDLPSIDEGSDDGDIHKAFKSKRKAGPSHIQTFKIGHQSKQDFFARDEINSSQLADTSKDHVISNSLKRKAAEEDLAMPEIQMPLCNTFGMDSEACHKPGNPSMSSSRYDTMQEGLTFSNLSQVQHNAESFTH